MTKTPIGAAIIGLDALRANPLRTILSTLGVIIGVGALVSVLSLGDSMERFARNQLARTTDVQTVTLKAKRGDWIDGKWMPAHDIPIFTPHDAQDIASELPMVRSVGMTLSGEARVWWPRSGKQRRASITASTVGANTFDRLRLAAGRFFTAPEASHNTLVIVLSHKLADELSGGRSAEAIVGEFVRVNGIPRGARIRSAGVAIGRVRTRCAGSRRRGPYTWRPKEFERRVRIRLRSHGKHSTNRIGETPTAALT